MTSIAGLEEDIYESTTTLADGASYAERTTTVTCFV
jgi:hypothetical protein